MTCTALAATNASPSPHVAQQAMQTLMRSPVPLTTLQATFVPSGQHGHSTGGSGGWLMPIG